MSSITESPSAHRFFEFMLSVTHFAGFSLVLLLAFFMNSFGAGSNWPSQANKGDGGDQLHGLLMTLGMVYLQGEALLAYRVYRYNEKLVSKLIHAALHSVVIGLAATAFTIIVMTKNLQGNTHFWSVHSWLGLALLFVYIMQYSFGFFVFLLPCAPVKMRAGLLPVHRVVGSICMGVAAVQCIIGFAQFIAWDALGCFFTLSCKSRIEIVANIMVLNIVVYAILIIVMITPAAWRRAKTPDELKRD